MSRPTEGLFSSARERSYWICAAAVVVAIYAALGVAPDIATFLRRSGLLVPTFVAGLHLILATIAAASFKAKLRGLEIAVLTGVLAVYLLLFVRIEIPEERSHLLEYSVLALFLYEALAERARNLGQPRLYWALAGVIAAMAGVLGEVLQSLIPSRVFDWRDIAFNTLAAVTAVAARMAMGWAKDRVGR